MTRHLLLVFGLLQLHSTRAAVEVVVETRTFHVPTVGPRVEVNMAIIAGSAITTPNRAGFMQARVEAITILEQGGAIKAFAKTEVLGPERLDSIQLDLIHQEFFDLPPGAYDLTVELRDLNSGDTTATYYKAPLAIGSLPQGISISDLLFAERIVPAEEGRPSKYGYNAIPLLSDYLPANIGTLEYYAEVYGSDARFGTDSLYLLTTQIENAEKAGVFGSFKHSQRMKARPVEPVMAHFDIAQLPSGNYLAVVEVRDRRGDLVVRREQFFQRNNRITFNYDLQASADYDLTNTFAGAFTNVDTLAEHVNSLRPIADPLERKIIDDRWKDHDMELMRRFFYSFWANRNPDPEAAWNAYRQEVIKVNKLFGCRVQKGYETDRGYVYLKYGPPNTMMDRFNEMGVPPYSIWHYYRAGRYTNKRFVFYQPDLASNCMQLLHSEVPGEMKNPQWQTVLFTRNQVPGDVQGRTINTIEGDRVRDYFDTPR